MEENIKDNSQKKVKSCAVCKHWRTKCNKDCPVAPYFPADNSQLFNNVHKFFGVTYMINALRSSPPDLRDDLMTSIIYSANARFIDPVRGCLGEIQLCIRKLRSLGQSYTVYVLWFNNLLIKTIKINALIINTLSIHNLFPHTSNYNQWILNTCFSLYVFLNNYWLSLAFVILFN